VNSTIMWWVLVSWWYMRVLCVLLGVWNAGILHHRGVIYSGCSMNAMMAMLLWSTTDEVVELASSLEDRPSSIE